jgi:hypothetical protein
MEEESKRVKEFEEKTRKTADRKRGSSETGFASMTNGR